MAEESESAARFARPGGIALAALAGCLAAGLFVTACDSPPVSEEPDGGGASDGGEASDGGADGGSLLGPDAGLALLEVVDVAVVPAAAYAGDTVTYEASLRHFLTPLEPGVSGDRCELLVQRPDGHTDATLEIAELGARITVAVPLSPGAVAGTWQLALRCRRWIDAAEIPLPSAPTAPLVVLSTHCDDLPAPLVASVTESYESFAGIEFGESHTWAWGTARNTYVGAEVQSIEVRSFSFVAPPAGRTGKVNFPSTTAGISVSVGRQCGRFDVPSACLGVASSAITWSTEASPASFRCALVPGQTYYLSYAWFGLADYLSDGSMPSTCTCPGTNCLSDQASCQFGNNSTP